MIENNNKRNNDKEIEDMIERALNKVSASMLNILKLNKQMQEDEQLTKILKEQIGCNNDDLLSAARLIINPIASSICDFIRDMPNLADTINESGNGQFLDMFNEEKLARLVQIAIALGVGYSKETIKELVTLSSEEEEKEEPKEEPKKRLALRDLYNYDDKDYSSPEEFIEDCLKSSQKELDDFLDKEDIDKERVVALRLRTGFKRRSKRCKSI